MRLDELEKSNAIQRSDVIHGDTEHDLKQKQTLMRHGTMNQYNSGVQAIMRKHNSDRPSLHYQNKTNPNIEDPLMSGITNNGHLYQIFENKLKGRVGDRGKFQNSLLKKFRMGVKDEVFIEGAKGGPKPIFRYDTEQVNLGSSTGKPIISKTFSPTNRIFASEM